MLYPFLITLVLIGYQVQGAAIQNEHNLMTFMERLSTTIKERCLRNGYAFNDVLGELTDFILCRESLISKNLTAPIGKLTEYCLEHIPEVVTCLTAFVEKLDPCLGNDEKYLKQFMFDAYDKYAEYACENLNVIITDVITTNTGKCVLQFFLHPDTDPHKICYGSSKIFGDNAAAATVTKSELCHDLYQVRACHGEIFDKHCPDAPEIKEFELGIMAAGLTPCADVMDDIGKESSNTITKNNSV